MSRRVALVTGSARGIGRAIAVRLAGDGLDVAVSDLPGSREQVDAVVAEVEAAGVRGLAVEIDVADADQCDAATAACAEAFGGLDVMVANAGVAVPAPLLETRPEDFASVLAVNLLGVFNCYAAAARSMIAAGGGGKIVGAGSLAAHKGFALLGSYSASKFGVRGLTQVAAQEWAPHGITVNAYCPGIVDTRIWASFDEATGAKPGTTLEQFAAQIALGRVQTPEDVAAFVSHLASEDSDYMTGQSVIVDGGVVFA